MGMGIQGGDGSGPNGIGFWGSKPYMTWRLLRLGHVSFLKSVTDKGQLLYVRDTVVESCVQYTTVSVIFENLPCLLFGDPLMFIFG